MLKTTLPVSTPLVQLNIYPCGLEINLLPFLTMLLGLSSMEPMSMTTGSSFVWDRRVMFSLMTSQAYLKASFSSLSSEYERSPAGKIVRLLRKSTSQSALLWL